MYSSHLGLLLKSKQANKQSKKLTEHTDNSDPGHWQLDVSFGTVFLKSLPRLLNSP